MRDARERCVIVAAVFVHSSKAKPFDHDDDDDDEEVYYIFDSDSSGIATTSSQQAFEWIRFPRQQQ